MKLSGQKRAVIVTIVYSISLFVWVLLLFNPGNIMTVEHCHVSASGPSAASLKMLLQMNPISSQLTGWGLMVIAMMLPKLTMSIIHIYSTSIKRKRFAMSLLFVIGYTTVWMAVGVLMIAIILTSNLLMPGSYIPAVILGVIAIFWQCTPVKQYSLNKGHNHRPLAAFGWAANRDALYFGVIHGFWCVCAGWAIMLLPMLLPHGHNLAMIIVTFIMLSEHLEHPKVPKWNIDPRTKLFRYVIARMQLRLKGTL